MLWVSVSLAIFNLLSVFPMDGGRVRRALLALRIDYVEATPTAAHIGQGMALLFGLIGLLANPFLIFIALFVWMGASQEASLVQIKSALDGIPVGQAMITEFHVLSSMDPASQAIAYILSGFQQEFPVMDDGKVAGILTQTDLFAALAQNGQGVRVGEIMQKGFETVDPSEMLELIFLRLQNCNYRTLPVIQNEMLVGLITTENIGEYMMIETSLKQGPEIFLRQISYRSPPVYFLSALPDIHLFFTKHMMSFFLDRAKKCQYIVECP
jgi:CBS domain-containing protein